MISSVSRSFFRWPTLVAAWVVLGALLHVPSASLAAEPPEWRLLDDSLLQPRGQSWAQREFGVMLDAARAYANPAGAAAARGKPAPERKKWEFMVAPYIWLPAMTGDLTIGGVTLPVDSSISDLFTESDFVFGLQMAAEAWYQRRWGLLFNGQWTVLKQNDNVISLPGPAPPFFPGPGSIEFDLKMNMGLFEFDAAYDFGRRPLGSGSGGPTWEVQPFVGARVTVINNEIELDGGGSNDLGKTWADPILGARGKIRFGNDGRFSWIIRSDFGGFGAGSDFTWSALGMFGYDFHIRSVASTVLLGARALYQDFEDDGGAFRWDVTQYGPLIALALHF